MAYIEAAESLSGVIALDPRDWSINPRDAWIYAIVMGWGDDALAELALIHGWSAETQERLKRLHENFSLVNSVPTNRLEPCP